MNVQNLFETLDALECLNTDLALQTRLEAISANLESLVLEPANTAHQSALALSLKQFQEATETLHNKIWPSRKELIKEIGGSDYFDPGMYGQISTIISQNAMTPSVARDFVRKLAKDRAAFLAVVTSTKQGISRLGVQGKPEEQPQAEMAFLIPRDLFDNHLGDLAKELQFINRLVLDFSEAVTGQSAPVEVHRLSSSIPTISLAADLSVMLLIGNIVKKFLDAWKTVEEIREIREKLRRIGMGNEATETELTNKIKKTISDVVDQTIGETMHTSPVDAGRKNELTIALKKDTLKLYSQIERGLNVEIRVNTSTHSEAANEVMDQLQSLSVKLQFPQVGGEPILLPPGDDDHDENHSGNSGASEKNTTPRKAKKKE